MVVGFPAAIFWDEMVLKLCCVGLGEKHVSGSLQREKHELNWSPQVTATGGLGANVVLNNEYQAEQV